MTVNTVSVGDMGMSCNVAGTSSDARAVIESVCGVIGQVSTPNRKWEYYASKTTLTRYGTATVSQLRAPLRALFSKPAQSFFGAIEKDLAQRMVPDRAGIANRQLAFAKVMVHEVDAWVTVVEQDGTTNLCRLDFSHRSDEDVANRRIHVVSELDYDSHQRLVRAIEDALGEQTA